LGLALSASPVCFPAEGGWQRDPTPLLTNFDNMYQPCVVEVGGAHRFRMWFFGWATAMGNPDVPGCDAVFHARSNDLKTWEVYAVDGRWDDTMSPSKWVPVLYASDRWYEAWHVGDPSVVLLDGRFYMAYSATSKPLGEVAGYPSEMVQCVMGAVSADGIHWTKTDEPLLLRPGDTAAPNTTTVLSSGQVSDRPETLDRKVSKGCESTGFEETCRSGERRGQETLAEHIRAKYGCSTKPEPERLGDFHRPCLRRDGGKWRLWFDYWLPGQGVCMGHAENVGEFTAPGGFRITHDLTQPVLAQWPNPEVIKVDGRYHAFGDPPGHPTREGASHWMSRQLREAVSDDGLTWQKLPFIPPDDDADACHVPQALVAEVDGKQWLYLFYATQIGYRRNDGQYHYQYDRLRAMRRPLPAGHVVTERLPAAIQASGEEPQRES